MTRLSEVDRAKIITLSEIGMNGLAIARKLGINRKTVSKWLTRHASTGSLKSVKPAGRPRLLDAAAQEKALELLVSGSDGGARFVARKLLSEKLTDKLVSTKTVTRGARKHAKESGDKVLCLRGRPKKGLTAANRSKRTAFALANLRTQFKKVMFTDRCKFYFRFPGSIIHPTRWILRSRRHEDACFKPNKPQAYNVYGGITPYGTTELFPVTGTEKLASKYKNKKGQPSRNITKAEYEHVAGDLLRAGNQLFLGRAGEPWVFQQDGDPTHSAITDALKTYHKGGGGARVTVLQNWPGNSPDLSPIENVWAWVDRQVAKKGCKTFDEFCAEVDRTFKTVPKDMLKNLYDSVPRRLQRVLENDGASTGY